MPRVKIPRISRTMVSTDGTKFKITNERWGKTRPTARLFIVGTVYSNDYTMGYRFSKKQLLHWYHGILKMLMLLDMEESRNADY